MDVAQVEQKLAALRADEEDTRQRLADVSEKLGQWLEGVRAAQAALIERARVAGLAVSAPPPAVDLGRSRSLSDEAADPKPEEPQDGDALLESLDEEMANAIRVKRRLSPNRSVRELLEELQLSRGPGENGRSKRWWRRRNE